MTENEKITKDILNLFPCALGDECQGIDYCKHCQQDKKLVLDALDTKDLKNKSLEAELSTLRKEKEVAVEALSLADSALELCRQQMRDKGDLSLWKKLAAPNKVKEALELLLRKDGL